MKRVAFIIALITVLSFTSCKSVNNGVVSSQKSMSDPFSADSSNDGSVTTAEFGQSFSDDIKLFTYNGDSVKVNYQLENSSIQCKLGIIVFVDGIVQKYSVDGKGENNYVNTFDLKPNQIIKPVLSFTPTVGKKGETLGVYITTINNPTFIPKVNYPSFGNNHAMSFNSPLPIVFNKNSSNTSLSSVNVGNTQKMTSEFKNKFNVNSGVNTLDTSPDIDFYEDKDNINTINLNKNEKMKLTLKGYGGNEATYRTTFFVNNKPIKTTDGHDFIDMKLKKDMITTAILNFDVNSFSGINCLYSVSIPIGDDYKKTNVSPIKTNSRLLIIK